ncbi:MAG: 50S ribosomal protein L24 [Pirellulales bacterium]
MRIKVDDMVKVVAGADRGVEAKVLKVLADNRKVIVEGVNRVFKHMRRSQRNPQGGRLSKEMPVAVSNVMLVCEVCRKATRVGVRYRDDGSKERFCKKCGAGNGLVSPPRKSYAK